MDFLVDHYIWIIAGFVAVLMTVIGYFAEKTGFGKKALAKRNKKLEEKSAEKVEEKIESKPEEVVLKEEVEKKEPEGIVFDNPFEEKVIEKKPKEEDLNVPLEKVSRKPISEDLNAPLVDEKKVAPFEEDLNVPFGDMEVASVPQKKVPERRVSKKEELDVPLEKEVPVRKPSKKITPIEEDLNAPFGDVTEFQKGSIDLELPEIDSIKEEVKASDNDIEEDIWKF